MNTTEYFKRTIQAYLEERAMEDELFAAKYDNPDKNIDDCVTYILNWVQKSGCNGFCDDEIYGQAIHYYEEKNIEVGKPLNCQVSVNHHIELTEEEKAQARQEAIRQYQQEQSPRMPKQAATCEYALNPLCCCCPSEKQVGPSARIHQHFRAN